MDIKIFVILFILMMIPLVSSLDDTVKRGDSYDIRVTPVANGSIASVTANITVNDPDGVVIVSFQEMTKNTASQDFNFTLPPSNTSKIGFYDCTVYAFSDIADNSVFSCNFEVNESGKAYIPEITGLLIFVAVLTLMFVSIFLFVLGLKIELFPMKVFLIILEGIVAIMNIGFVTGSFQEFLSTGSDLSGAFGVLYITFIMLLTGSSIFLLMWIVISGFKIYRIKRGFYVDP